MTTIRIKGKRGTRVIAPDTPAPTTRSEPQERPDDYHARGGHARAASLTPERRSAIAKHAAQTRFLGKTRQPKAKAAQADGVRLNHVKNALSTTRPKAREMRVAILVGIARDKGRSFLLHEIEVLEEKIAVIREALDRIGNT